MIKNQDLIKLSVIMYHLVVVTCRAKNNLSYTNGIDEYNIQDIPTYIEKLDCTWTGCQINEVELDDDRNVIQYDSDFCDSVYKLKTPKSGWYRFNNRYLFCEFTSTWEDQKYVVSSHILNIIF